MRKYANCQNKIVHNLFTTGLTEGRENTGSSTARDDFYDLQFVARVQLPPRKFRRRDRLAVVLHDDAARRQFLRDQKFPNRARQLRRDWLSVGSDETHENGFLISKPCNRRPCCKSSE